MSSAADSLSKARYFDPLGWFVLRAPLLPIDAYLQLAGAGGACDGRFGVDDPWVALALVVGGGRLSKALGNGPASDSAALGKLLRYQIRMSTRPTPYGLFAGVALAEFGDETPVAMGPVLPIRRARPDMQWLLSLLSEIEQRPEVLRQVSVVAHPAAFEHGGRFHLGETNPLRDNFGSQAASIRATSASRKAMALAQQPIAFAGLVSALREISESSEDKAVQLLTELHREGFLQTQLRPVLTSHSPAQVLFERLAALPAPPPETTRLGELLQRLDGWAALAPEIAAQEWHAIETEMRTLHETKGQAKAGASEAVIEVDMGFVLEPAKLSAAVGREAAAAAQLLLRLGTLPRGMPYLAGYRAAFVARYGPDRAVPLLELLDPQLGLGPPGAQMGGPLDARRFAIRNEALQSLAIQAAMQRQLAVSLDLQMIERLSLCDLGDTLLPVSLDIAVFVLAESTTAIDRGEFRIAVGPNVGAGQAGRYLARFGDVLGAAVTSALQEIHSAESRQMPNSICAELVYLPRRLRSANVVVRPVVREREIGIGVSPGVAREMTIALDDLAVSVRDGRFQLTSIRDGVQVVVRACHMLNSMQATSVARLLSDIGEDGVAQLLGFDWGPVANHSFLPRLEFGRIVLTPARWRISKQQRDTELTAKGSGFAERLAAFRSRWNVPRHVYLAMSDNRLLLDLDAPAQAAQLLDELQRLGEHDAVLLHEAIPGPEHAWLPGPRGNHMAELVIPLVRKKAPLPARPDARPAAAPTLALRAPASVADNPFARLRPPGSDWLFVKLYGPERLEDELLAGPLAQFCASMCESGPCSSWFFLRYGDPEAHLRIRFRGDPRRLLQQLLPNLCEWTADHMADGLLQRFAVDTYDREIERYGGDAGLAACESLFAVDSAIAIDILALLQANPKLDRIAILLCSVDHLLEAFAMEPDQRLTWASRQVASRRSGGDEFRKRKEELRSWLSRGDVWRQVADGRLATLLAQRTSTLASRAQKLIQLELSGSLDKPLEEIIQSVVHMHCNRVAGRVMGVDEQVLALLARTYRSLAESPTP